MRKSLPVTLHLFPPGTIFKAQVSRNTIFVCSVNRKFFLCLCCCSESKQQCLMQINSDALYCFKPRAGKTCWPRHTCFFSDRPVYWPTSWMQLKCVMSLHAEHLPGWTLSCARIKHSAQNSTNKWVFGGQETRKQTVTLLRCFHPNWADEKQIQVQCLCVCLLIWMCTWAAKSS